MGRVFLECAPASEADLHHTYGVGNAMGMRKLDPLVMVRHDPATLSALSESASDLSKEHRPVCSDPNALVGDILDALPCRGVALDDVHLSASVSAPLADVSDVASERHAAHANIPCVVWRRTIREDLHAESGRRTIVDAIGVDMATLEATLAPFNHTCVALFDDPGALGPPDVHLAQLAADAASELGCAGLGKSLYALVEDGSGAMRLRPSKYQVAWAVVFRLLQGHRMLRAVERLVRESNEDDDIVAHDTCILKKSPLMALAYQAQLFMDTHLALYAAVDASGRGWSDVAVLGVDGRGLMPSEHGLLACAYPHCRAVASCEGELPDMGALIACTNVDHDQSSTPSSDLCLQRAMVHLFLLKVMNHPWMMRSFKEMLTTYLLSSPAGDGYPSLRAFFFRVIECGLLGNWKTTKCGGRAVWQRRLEVYRSVRDMAVRFPIAKSIDEGRPQVAAAAESSKVDAARALREWIDCNRMACFYIFKEHLVRQVELLTAFEVSMHWTMRWGHFKALVRGACNRMRVLHNDRCRGVAVHASRPPTHVETDQYVARQLKQMHNIGKNSCLKLHKHSFPVVVTHQMDVILSSLRRGSDTRVSLKAQEKDLFFFRAPRYEGDDTPATRDTDDLDTDHAEIERDDAPSGRNASDRAGSEMMEDVALNFDESDEGDEDDEEAEENNGEDGGHAPKAHGKSKRSPSPPHNTRTNANHEGVGRSRNVATMLTRKIRALAMRMQPYVDVDLMDMVAAEACRRQQSSDRVEMRWLDELFGVVERHAEMVRRLYMRHEVYDLNDNRIKTIVGHLYYCSPRDFHVVRLYLCLVLWHRRRAQFIVLDSETRHRQLVSLRRRYQIPSFEPLPRHVGWAFYNPMNMRWSDFTQRRPQRRIGNMITHRKRWHDDADAVELIHCRRRVRRFGANDDIIAERRKMLLRLHYQEMRNSEIDALTLGIRATSSFIDHDDRETRPLMPWPRPPAEELSVYTRERQAGNDSDDDTAVRTPAWPPGGALDANGVSTCRTNVFLSGRDRRAYLESPMVRSAGHWSTGRIDQVELCATDLVGVAVYMNGRLYTRCVDCGVLMRLGCRWRTVSERGPTCGVHDPMAWTHRKRQYLRRMRIDRPHHSGTRMYMSQAGQAPAAQMTSRWLSVRGGGGGGEDDGNGARDECVVCRILGPCQAIAPYTVHVARERAENAKALRCTAIYYNTGKKAAVSGVGAESRKAEREANSKRRTIKSAQSAGRRCVNVLVLADRDCTGRGPPLYCKSIPICKDDSRLGGDLLRYAVVRPSGTRTGTLPPPLAQLLDVCATQRAVLQRNIARRRRTTLGIARQHMDGHVTMSRLEAPDE